jgi:hypothetical protein
VAAADVAPGAHEHGHHVLFERDRPVLLRLRDLHRNLHRLPAERDRHLRRTVGERIDVELVELHERGVGEAHLGLRGDVSRDAVGLRELHDERLPVACGFEVDVRRVHRDLLGERGFTAEGAEGTEGKQRTHIGKPHAVIHQYRMTVNTVV